MRSAGSPSATGSVAPSPKRTQRARAPPDSTVKRRWRPSPIGRGSRQPRAVDHQADRRVGPPERREPAQLLGQREPHLAALDDGVDALQDPRLPGADRLPGMRGERGRERVERRAVELDARGRAVPAEAHQMPPAAFEPAEQVEAVDAAPRAAAALPVEGHHHDRAPALLHEPRGDDPDHARVPALSRQHVAPRADPARPSALRPRSGCAARSGGARSSPRRARARSARRERDPR